MKTTFVSTLFKTILFGTLLNTVSFAQTDQHNLDKYWKLRNSFREKFVKIGPLPGESLPAGSRKPHDCVDDINDGVYTHYGTMHWGDGMIRHGHYLGLLATEYKLLKNSGQDVSGVLNELYYALQAINRLDATAEPNLAPIYGYNTGPALNGFFLREDIPGNFANDHWGTDQLNARCVNSAFYETVNASQAGATGNSYQNVPSMDQLSGLMVGFSLIHKLVDPNESVQPPGSNTTYNVLGETKQIVNRIMSYLATHNWYMIDVNGWPVANGGGDAAYAAYPLCLAAQRITGINYSGNITRFIGRVPTIQHCVTGYGSDGGTTQQQSCNQLLFFPNEVVLKTHFQNNNADVAGPNNNQSSSVFQTRAANGSINLHTSLTANIWPGVATSLTTEFFNSFANANFIKSYNKTIVYNLGVASGTWGLVQSNIWANSTQNYALDLANMVIQGVSSNQNKTLYTNLLNGMNKTGPYNLRGHYWNPDPALERFVSKSEGNGWYSENRWTNPTTTDEFGVFNGIDYMLFHNLYRLVYNPQGFTPSYDCNCSNPIQLDPASSDPLQSQARIDLNKRLLHLETCDQHVFGTTTNVTNTQNIYPKFQNYADLNIFTSDFVTLNTTIAPTGNVNVFNRFIICNSQTLTIQSGGKLTVHKGEVMINTVARINSSGEIRVKSGTKLTIASSGRLALLAGSKLIIEDNAKLIIEPGAVLEYSNGAQLITEGANSEIIMRSTIKIMDVATFKVDHSASSQSGRFRMEGGRFIGAVPGAKVELIGKNISDEFIVLKENTAFMLTDFNVSSMRIENCKIDFPTGSSIRIEQPFGSAFVNYNSAFNNGGLIFTESASLTRCNFNNTYINAELAIENIGKLKLTMCQFTKSNTALNTGTSFVRVNGGGYEIYESTFSTPGHTSLYSSAMIFPSKIYHSTFTSSGSGIGLQDHSATDLYLSGNLFNNLQTGVFKVYGKLSMKCNTFQNIGNFNVEANLGCLLNMSISDGAGYNILKKTATGQNIYLESATLSAYDGYNFIEEGSLSAIEGTVPACSGIFGCITAYGYNQWNTANTVPAASKFNLISTNNNVISPFITPVALKPACGFFDPPVTPVDPENPGESGRPMASEGNESGNLPETLTAFGMNRMEFLDSSGNDLEAIETFHKLFTDESSKSAPDAGKTREFALTKMKTALEHAIATGKITRAQNESAFEPHVAMYADALMYMTDSVIDQNNYVTQFYHEMNKAHLFRAIGHSKTGLKILSGLENCGLDSTEQKQLNHWKSVFKMDLIMEIKGSAILDTLIVIDTTGYISPKPKHLNDYFSSTRINSLYDVSFSECGDRPFTQPVKSTAAFTLYPNPASDQVTVLLNHPAASGGSSELIFQNAEGKLIYKTSFKETENIQKTVAISDWKPGIYLYKYTTQDGKLFTGKLIVY